MAAKKFYKSTHRDNLVIADIETSLQCVHKQIICVDSPGYRTQYLRGHREIICSQWPLQLLWSNDIIFERSQKGYLWLAATTVCCGQRTQHLRSQRTTVLGDQVDPRNKKGSLTYLMNLAIS